MTHSHTFVLGNCVSDQHLVCPRKQCTIGMTVKQNGKPSFLFLCHALLVCHLIHDLNDGHESFSVDLRALTTLKTDIVSFFNTHIAHFFFFCQLREKCNVGPLFCESPFLSSFRELALKYFTLKYYMLKQNHCSHLKVLNLYELTLFIIVITHAVLM